MNLRSRARPTPAGWTHTSTHPGSRSRRRRPAVNITSTERAGRVLIGGAAAIAGVVLLTSAASILAVVLVLFLIAAGLDLVVTGVVGHCPLYKRLGHVPASLRRPA